MFPILALHLPDYFYFVFAVCALVSVCIVLFVAKRHPNPHFRPKKSEVAILSLLLFFASGGVALVTSGAFDANFDKEKLEAKLKAAKNKVESGEGQADGSAGGGTSEGGNSNLPDDVPDDFRTAIEGK